MIARDDSKPSPRGPLAGILSRWLDRWQRALARAVAGVSGAWVAVVRATRSVPSLVERLVASGALTDVRHQALAWFGGCAVLLGAAVGTTIAAPGIDRRAAALAGAASLMWAGLRWLVIRRAAPRLAAEDPAMLRGALSLGLLVYAAAVTPELRFAAWLGSGAVSAVTLVRFGRDRREVSRGVALAWGTQALVVIGGWVARSVLVAVLATRG